MNSSLAVMKKDLRHFRWLLALWCGVVLFHGLMGVLEATVFAHHLAFQMNFAYIQQALQALELILMIILIPLIVQDDPVMGPRAFWKSRPVTSRSLLVAKAGLAVMFFVGLPLAIELFVLMVNGAPVSLLLSSVQEIFLKDLVFLGVIFFLSAITESLSHFIIAGLVFMMFSWFSAILFATGMVAFIETDKHLIPLMVAYEKQYDVLLHWSFFASVFAVLVICQYSWRRRKFVIAGLVMAMFLVPLRVFFMSQSQEKISPPEVTSGALDAVTFTYDRAAIDVSENERAPGLWWKVAVSTRLNPQNLPQGQFAVLADMQEAEIIYPSGEPLLSSPIISYAMSSKSDEEFQDQIQFALKDYLLLNPRAKMLNGYSVFALSKEEYDSRKGQRGYYKAQELIDVYEYQPGLKIPLNPGAGSRDANSAVKVLNVVPEPGKVTVLIKEKRLEPFTARRSFSGQMNQKHRKEKVTYFKNNKYVLCNARTHEALLLDGLGEDKSTELFFGNGGMAGAPLTYKIRPVYFSTKDETGKTIVKIDDAWLADAELVRLDAVKVGSVRRNIEIPGFTLPEETK